MSPSQHRFQFDSTSRMVRPKVLRIAVLAGDRIIEERILGARESVSVGQSARSTFIITHPSLPAYHVLFETKGGGYVLCAAPFMRGSIKTAGGTVGLDGASARIPLGDDSRGKIAIGDTTLLFQFVVLPRPRPRPQLPSSMRGAWLGQLGALFGAGEGHIGFMWLALFCCSTAIVVFFNVADWPEEGATFDIDNRWIELALGPPDDVLEKETRKADTGADLEGGEAADEEAVETDPDPGTREVEGPRSPLGDEDRAAADARRKAMLKALVEKSGLAAVIGSQGGGGAGAFTDMLKGSGVATDIDEVMRAVTGLRSAGPDDMWSKLGGPAAGGGTAVDLDVRDAQAADAEISVTDAVEKSPGGRIDTGPIEERDSPGILDEKEVVVTVRKSLPAIRNCYEKGLSKNPLLEGKIKVAFTVGPQGVVTGAQAEDDSLGDPNVTSCVLGKFKSLKFDKPEGGSAKFVYPLMFKPGG